MKLLSIRIVRAKEDISSIKTLFSQIRLFYQFSRLQTFLKICLRHYSTEFVAVYLFLIWMISSFISNASFDYVRDRFLYRNTKPLHSMILWVMHFLISNLLLSVRKRKDDAFSTVNIVFFFSTMISNARHHANYFDRTKKEWNRHPIRYQLNSVTVIVVMNTVRYYEISCTFR